jgi:hypothetical protein
MVRNHFSCISRVQKKWPQRLMALGEEVDPDTDQNEL